MSTLIFLTFALFGNQSGGSPFNSGSLFLSPRRLPGGCSIRDSRVLQNRVYTFLGPRLSGAPVTLRDGKALERDEKGTVDWETSLVSQNEVRINNRPAILLVFTSEHLTGTGAWTTVLAATCDAGQMEVLLEGEGEGLHHAFLASRQEIVLTWAVWAAEDAHCCPSRELEEHYRWSRANARFARVSKVERKLQKQ